MAVGRRSFLALLGLGGAAAPVALPAFGKVVAQQQLSRGAMLGGISGVGQFYGENPAPDPMYHAGRSLKDKLVQDFLGHLIIDQQEAEAKRNRFHDVAIENYQLPSWSPSFRQHMTRKEYEARTIAARSIREQIQEKMKSFVGFDDKNYNNDQCETTSPRGY